MKDEKILPVLDDLNLAQTDQRLLIELGEIWRILFGHVLVYVALRDQYGFTGPPHYVTTCRAGQIFMGGQICTADGEFNVSITVVAGEQADLKRVDHAQYDKVLDGHVLEEWLLSLCRDMGEWPAQGLAQAPESRNILTVPPDGVFRARGTELETLCLEEGEAKLGGAGGACWLPCDGEIIANNSAWFVAGAAGAKLSLEPSLVDTAKMVAATQRMMGLWLHATLDVLLKNRIVEAERLNSSSERRATTEKDAVDALRFTADGKSSVPPRPNDPLVAALEMIGREADIEFDMHIIDDTRRSLSERIERTAEFSGARSRQVDLSGDWLSGDAGVILALSESGLPRVFIPRARWFNMKLDYIRYAPELGEKRTATSEDTEELEEKGFTFSTPVPDVIDKKDDNKINHWKITWYALKPQLGDMRQVMLLMLVGLLLGMLTPVAHFIIIDKVIPNDERELLFGIGLAAGGLTLCTFAFGLAQARVNLRVQSKIFVRMQAGIIDRLIRLPNRFFRKYPTGELLKRALMISDISIGLMSTVSGAISAVIGTILMTILCFYYSSTLAWLALVAALTSAVLTVTVSYMMRRRNIQMQLLGGRNMGFLMQIIQSVGKLQAARSEDRAFSGWAHGKGDILRMQYANTKLEYNAGILGGAIRTGTTIALYYIAGQLVLKSQIEQALNPLAEPLLTIGIFFAFQRSFTSVIDYVGRFFVSFVDAHEQLVKRELVRPILEIPIEQKRDRIDPGRLQGRVELRRVSFRYSEEGPIVLEGVSLDVHDGEFIGLVGPSGAGKSTIIGLVLGFEAPEAGSVLIDGRPLETLDMGAVRRQIGVVLQNDRIPGGTLYQAIAGASNMTLDQAWLAARDAGLEPDIKAMPMGMHSLLPEGGGTLSGGQRQRLSIARALSHDPRIMLFDEATSALDNRSQAIVSASLKRRRVTRIVVAHRLSTIADADRIFVLDRGRLVESGAPEELRKAGGLFTQLSKNQNIE